MKKFHSVLTLYSMLTQHNAIFTQPRLIAIRIYFRAQHARNIIPLYGEYGSDFPILMQRMFKIRRITPQGTLKFPVDWINAESDHPCAHSSLKLQIYVITINILGVKQMDYAIFYIFSCVEDTWLKLRKFSGVCEKQVKILIAWFF